MEQYILNLYKQFCDARGITCNPLEFNKFSSEFIEWVASNRILTNKYREFILSLGYMDGKTVSEIGKGKYDSLELIDSIIVSPYAATLGFDNSKFIMIGNCLLIKKNNEIIMPSTDFLTTHNPYEEMLIYNWYKIHNSRLYDISIGMYGNIHDRNFDERIKLLENISKQMDDDHIINYDTDNDNYFCAINSKRMVKRKILTR